MLRFLSFASLTPFLLKPLHSCFQLRGPSGPAGWRRPTAFIRSEEVPPGVVLNFGPGVPHGPNSGSGEVFTCVTVVPILAWHDRL